VAAIDSGNGVQCLWRLADPIMLGKPVRVKVKVKVKGKDKLVSKLQFLPADQAAIDDVEGRIKDIMVRLGAKPGTQNIDRILRLPGTTNRPNAAKREQGRIECMTELLWFEDSAYPLDAFPKPEQKTSDGGKKQQQHRAEQRRDRARDSRRQRAEGQSLGACLALDMRDAAS
jgi:hypothetical protein